MPDDPAVMPDEEVKAPPSTEKPEDVPAPEPDDTEAKAEDTEAETEPEEEKPEEEEPPKKKTSGYARLKARHERLLAQLEAQRREREQPQQEQEPKVDDYNGDYLAYEKAAIAFAARQAIRQEMADARQQDFQAREAQSKQEVIEDFFERTEEAKTKIKDFDQAIDGLYGAFGPLPNMVRDKIAEADNGPQILYYLAKNPSAARELYESTPVDALYQIGRLDEKMALPEARRSSKAPPPMTTPRGGASPPRDIHQLASKSESIDDYVRARRADEKNRSKED